MQRLLMGPGMWLARLAKSSQNLRLRMKKHRKRLVGGLFALLVVTTPAVIGLAVQNNLFGFFSNGVASAGAQLGEAPEGGLTIFSPPNLLGGPARPSSRMGMNSLNPVWYPEFSQARNVVSQGSSSWGYSAADKTGFGGFGPRQSTMDLWIDSNKDRWAGGGFTENPGLGSENFLTRAGLELSEGGGDPLLDEFDLLEDEVGGPVLDEVGFIEVGGVPPLDENEAQLETVSVPEPGTLLLLVSGLLAMVGLSLRRGSPGRGRYVTELS